MEATIDEVLKNIREQATRKDRASNDVDLLQRDLEFIKELNETLKGLFGELKTAIGDYKKSEGCSCCRNVNDHNLANERIAKILGVPKYRDESGYDFSKL